MKPRAGKTLGSRRLIAQLIGRPTFTRPNEVVAWLGAMQAQDYAAAKWAIGLRLPDGAATDADIERAVADGSVIRLHAMRWTWQFVVPADARWMLSLLAPRLVVRASARHRELELDAATFRQCNAALEKALGSGRHLTRDELGVALGRAGIAASGPRLAHLLAHAELSALICSAGRRGKQFTYTLLDRWAPASASFTRQEALAELARRYFQSRGPATAADFAWWSGLTSTDARMGLESIASSLVSEVRDKQTYWRADDAPAAPSPRAHLLPAFDEYLIGYRDRADVLDPKDARRVNAGGGMLGPCIVVKGRVVGTWRRVLGRSTVEIETKFFHSPTAAERRAVNLAARRYGAFVGLEVGS